MLDFLRPAVLAKPSTRQSGAQGLFYSALIGTSLLLGCSQQASSPDLPKLKIDPARVSVSGISSGAYMAAQAHVAFSNRIHGAAMLAGGPFGCAEGNLDQALSTCMKGVPAPDVAKLVTRAQQLAAEGKIDALAGLQDDPIYLAHGSNDAIVSRTVVEAAANEYKSLAPNARVQTEFDLAIAHLWPSAKGGDCSNQGQHLADCGIDLAQQMAAALEPATAATDAAPAASGKLLTFAQNLRPNLAADAHMDDIGFIYVPSVCEQGTCGLHIVFHGCEMNREKIGDAFAAQPDWHRQADARHLVLLYPQTVSSLMPLNPKGCWDWWGYTGQTYDQKQGAQLQWLDAVLQHFGLSDSD